MIQLVFVQFRTVCLEYTREFLMADRVLHDRYISWSREVLHNASSKVEDNIGAQIKVIDLDVMVYDKLFTILKMETNKSFVHLFKCLQG